MLRRLVFAGLVAAATIPVTSTPASAICTIYVPTGEMTTLLPDVGPLNCNVCPVVERNAEGLLEKVAGRYIDSDVMVCWT